MAAYGRALEVLPDNAEALVGRGMIHQQMGRSGS
jgi:hypothetical protein